MQRLNILFLVATFACTTGVQGSVIVSGFAQDELSSATGVVSVDVDGFETRDNIVVSNTTSGESYQFDLAGTLGGTASTGATGAEFNEVGSDTDYSLNSLAMNVKAPAANNGDDETANFDGRSGANEGALVTFDTAAILSSASFAAIAYDSNTDYEVVELYVNNVLTHTLFSDDVVETDSAYTSATGAITSSGGDDFPSLNIALSAGDTLEFRMNGTPLTGAGQQVGWVMEQFTLVPEPTGLGMALIATLALLGFRRR